MKGSQKWMDATWNYIRSEAGEENPWLELTSIDLHGINVMPLLVAIDAKKPRMKILDTLEEFLIERMT
jgi:hypothetical protein